MPDETLTPEHAGFPNPPWAMAPALKLNQLRAFLATVNASSTLRATRVVNRTQPAISAAIAGLEAALGLSLFQRSARGMAPTVAGWALAARVATGLARLRGRRGESGHFANLVTDVQLRAFSAMIEAGGFSAAARKLRLSQPSVHRAVHALQELVGVPLWHRRGQRIEPTQEARALCVDIDLWFSEVRLGVEEAQDSATGAGGRLLIGALPTARSAWLPRSLAATVTKYPEARAAIIDGPYDEQLKALRHGRIDLILGALRLPVPSPDIEQQEVYRDAMSIVVGESHPLARASGRASRPLTVPQLRALSWILPPVDSPVRHCFDAFMQARGLPLSYRALESTSILTIQALLGQTDFAAIIPTSQMESESVRSHLRVLGSPLRGSTHPVGITLRRAFHPTRLQRAFIDTVYRLAPRSLVVD